MYIKSQQKQTRTEAIINFITDSSVPIPISEIFQKLLDSGATRFSRKTIERDVVDLIKKHVVFERKKTPLLLLLAVFVGL